MSNSTSSTKLMIPALGGLYESLAPLAYPLIRFSAGLILMPHGAQKLFGWFGGGGISGTAGFFSSLGLEPAVPLVLLVGLVEFVGGLAIAIGLWTRLAAALAAIDLLATIYLVHFANGFFWNAGGYEFPLLWAIVMIAIVIRGGQKMSLDSVIGKEF
ncbi:MAG: DoxX family protein [Alphaproteobacteria bacterium]